jgi:hypothetical protein
MTAFSASFTEKNLVILKDPDLAMSLTTVSPKTDESALTRIILIPDFSLRIALSWVRVIKMSNIAGITKRIANPGKSRNNRRNSFFTMERNLFILSLYITGYLKCPFIFSVA